MYGVKLEDVKFNGKSSNICKGFPNGCLMTFDSGTSLMSFPPAAVEALAQAGVPFPTHVKKCNKAEDYGAMDFIMGGQTYTLSNKEWMFKEQSMDKKSLVQGGKQEVMFKTADILGPQIMAQVDVAKLHKQTLNAGNKFDFDVKEALSQTKGEGSINACSSLIQPMKIDKDMFLVGDVFMRKYYTIFDRDANRVGLAAAKGYIEAAEHLDV